MADQLSEANARLIEIVDGWALVEECDLPLDRLEKLLNAARAEGPHTESGEAAGIDAPIPPQLIKGYGKTRGEYLAAVARLPFISAEERAARLILTTHGDPLETFNPREAQDLEWWSDDRWAWAIRRARLILSASPPPLKGE